MSEKSVIDMIDEAIGAGTISLPVFPAVIAELRSAVANPNCSSEQVAQQINQDAGLASQILKVANSTFYAGLNKVATIRNAVSRLGLIPTVQIATMVAQKAQFSSTDPMFRRNFETLWKHSVACALGSEWLAKRLGLAALASDVFMAGLFHDIGKLLLLKALDEIQQSQAGLKLAEEVVTEVLEQFHAEKGARLLEQWNLPESFAAVARNHHAPLTSDTSNLELVVRTIDLVACKLGIGFRHDPELSITNTDEAERLGVTAIMLAELEIALEDALAVAA